MQEIFNDTLKSALKEVAVPLQEVDFTRENYNRLFPRNRIQTPIESVKMGENQFEKMNAKERQKLMLAAHDTLTSPDIVVSEMRKTVFGDERLAHLYAKSFVIGEKEKAVQSVVVAIDGENVSISSHERDISNIVNKIKEPDQLLYAAAKVRLLVEQHTGEKLPQSVVNQIREDEYVASPNANIPQTPQKSNENSGQNLLEGCVKIEVNGKVRECKNGVLEGFKNAVKLVDRLMDVNHQLADENEKLRNQIHNQNKNKKTDIER